MLDNGTIATQLPAAAFRTVVAPPGALGLKIGTHADGHACILEVESGSPLAGKVGIGDVVMEVDGDDTAQHTHEELMAYLATKSGDAKTLRMRAPLRTVVAPPGPLGLVFTNHADGHWHIDEVEKDSPLRHALSVGDVIIATDGEDTSVLSHEELVRRVDEKCDVEKVLLVRRCLVVRMVGCKKTVSFGLARFWRFRRPGSLTPQRQIAETLVESTVPTLPCANPQSVLLDRASTPITSAPNDTTAPTRDRRRRPFRRACGCC